METLGIKTIGDLSRFDVQKLIANFGKTLGTYFHYAALGLDDSPVSEKGMAQSVSRISTLREDTRDVAVIMNKIETLCKDIYINLSQMEIEFKTVSAVAVLKDMSVHSRSRTFKSPVPNLELLTNTVKELFHRLIGETNLEIRRAGVKISGFSEKHEKQRRLTDF